MNGVYQAIYTAGVTLPTPVCISQYYHYPLNVKKLIDIGFWNINLRTTISQNIKLYRLGNCVTKLKPLEDTHCIDTCKLLNGYLEKFKLHMNFDIEEFKHWFMGRDNVIQSYIVENNNEITDMVSFYIVPSTILNHHKHKILNVGYLYYYVSTKTPLAQLVNDILIIAKDKNIDVFNCLNIHDNMMFIDKLKFKVGDGDLKYYLYNWITTPFDPNENGMVLL
jgi:glycylpeptide N-tetradecanoyltransferase